MSDWGYFRCNNAFSQFFQAFFFNSFILNNGKYFLAKENGMYAKTYCEWVLCYSLWVCRKYPSRFLY